MRSRTASALALLAALVTLSLQPATGQESRRERGMGRGAPGHGGRRAVRVKPGPNSDLLTGDDAIAALRGRVGDRLRGRGENPETVVRAIGVDPTIAVGVEGQMVFLDAADPDDVALAAAAAATDPAATTAPTETVPDPDALAANGLPLHHSKPGAPWTMFVDVQSQTIPVHPVMRNMLGLRSTVVVTQGLTLDADSATFNAEEQLLVSRIWARVAEDYAPFDIDVTTERPAAFATSPWGGGRVLWNLVTRSETAIGFPVNSLYGIAAAPSICGLPGGFLGQPTFTFWGTTTPMDHDLIADTISHEAGHVLGLVHDGFMLGNSFMSYYAGHGTGATSWGPLMGGPTARNVTQWSAGGYPNASNGNVCGPGFQDDIAHIASTLGFRADDIGDTLATATPLTLPATGIIGTTTDVDVFALPSANQVRIDVTPFRAGDLTDGGNLDVAAEIVNASGLVVASADDVSATAATLTATLPAGQHYLRIRASFDPTNYPIYGSAGQYTVTGTFTTLSRLTRVSLPDEGEIEPGRRLPVRFTLSDAVTRARVQLWSDASPLTATVLAEAPCVAQRNLRQRCQLKVPRRLPRADTYWLAIQYQGADGSWITADVDPDAGVVNPLPLRRD